MAKRKETRPSSPWDKQPDESAKAFEAFETYLKMGTYRSFAKVGKALGKTRQAFEGWAVRFRWAERIHAWDAEQARVRLEKHAKELEEMRERHRKTAKGIQSVFVTKLVHLQKNPKLIEEMKLEHLASLFKIAVELERLAMDLPSNKLEVTTPELGKRAEQALRDRHVRKLLDEAASRLGLACDSGGDGGDA